jgi:preprotein translocase subunit SecE
MNILKYLKEVKLELGKVTWPERSDSIRLTSIVIIASFVVGLYVGGLDIMFTSLLGLFIK